MAKAQTAEIEIISWWHEFGTLLHQGVLRYIGNLPKGSSLAIELGSREILFLRKLTTLLFGGIPIQEFAGAQEEGVLQAYQKLLGSKPPEEVISKVPLPTLVGIQLLHLCKKAGIRIISIETLASEDAKYSSPETFEAMLRGSIQRRRLLAEEIQRRLETFTGTKLYVLTGLIESPFLQDALFSRGLKSNITTRPFGQSAAVVTEIIKLYEEAKSVAREGRDMTRMQQIIRRVDEISGELKQPQNIAILRQGLVAELQTAATTRLRRLKQKRRQTPRRPEQGRPREF